MELYAKVRYAVRIEGLSERAAARRFGIDPRTVAKMMRFSVPPGYRRTKPPVRPKLDRLVAIIERILAEDKGRPKKQHHMAKRIFERLRDEHGFAGGITIVKDYVAGWRQRAQEMFVPLAHPPGHAQADFGEALGIISGVERKIHFFPFDLPHSDAGFVVAYMSLIRGDRLLVAARALLDDAYDLGGSLQSSTDDLGACLREAHPKALPPRRIVSRVWRSAVAI